MLYSPNRPVVDFSVVFLWLIAVGTIVCASLWSEFTANEQSDECYNELSPKQANTRAVQDDAEKEVLDITAKSAIVFVITASTFLVLLYLFMSSWFVWLLIVLFCIGGLNNHQAVHLVFLDSFLVDIALLYVWGKQEIGYMNHQIVRAFLMQNMLASEN
ncbi:similar to SIGNAL PEPTIDE PEPTIDASE-LIKE 5 [Actinidia rufa]|uniref:Similar to SIGNAL PEPTIDE PEPTIDASE-LIKE 5 n=1 Tax=Actinidia rufa TaxID=165716 RepID=A0A7J0F4L8_9ERIC|nr:similar to SIGNAL PEPTIDE PEPTIDASE-LIKE 5 [Actinidia rufa]